MEIIELSDENPCVADDDYQDYQEKQIFNDNYLYPDQFSFAEITSN